jgi:hypothetical protein
VRQIEVVAMTKLRDRCRSLELAGLVGEWANPRGAVPVAGRVYFLAQPDLSISADERRSLAERVMALG